MSNQMRVLLSTEGTYPFHQGGVSTWCETLVNKMEMVDFVIYSIIGNPFITQKFKLPDNASLQPVPLWGTEEPKEYLQIPFSDFYLPKKHTTDEQVQEHFLPLFVQVVEEIITEVKSPRKFGQLLADLYTYFQEYDYKVSFKSNTTWELYKELIVKASQDKKYRLSQPDVYGLIQSLGWIYRFFTIVNTPIPQVTVTHSTAAAFCGIPCVISKIKYKTPFLLTEHGVYLREQYLALSKQPYSSFLNTFLIRLVQSLTSMNYAFADQVSPVAYYNTRWETRFGVPVERIEVIQNGVDPAVFVEAPPSKNEVPTVMMMARIDPLKDILTFLRAAAIVKERVQHVKFVVYGSVSIQEYYKQCEALRQELGLQDCFEFAGHTTNIAAAYHSGDIVALTSISEGFPYTVIEAMMTGKPVVATDVGGVSEAIGDTGLMVPPRNPEAYAEALLKLVTNKELRESLGRDARERALSFFTLDKVIEMHLKAYIKLATRAVERAPRVRRDDSLDRQKLLLERGSALLANGLYQEALGQLQAALQEKAKSPYVPVILTEIAGVYNRMGEYDMAFETMEKCKAYTLATEPFGKRETA